MPGRFHHGFGGFIPLFGVHCEKPLQSFPPFWAGALFVNIPHTEHQGHYNLIVTTSRKKFRRVPVTTLLFFPLLLLFLCHANTGRNTAYWFSFSQRHRQGPTGAFTEYHFHHSVLLSRQYLPQFVKERIFPPGVDFKEHGLAAAGRDGRQVRNPVRPLEQCHA